MPGLDDLRVEPQALAAGVAHELHLLDVEAEVVQPAQALVDAVASRPAPNTSSRVSSDHSAS